MNEIIVIDDEPQTLQVLCELLRLHNFDVVAVGSNGKDALELYKEYKPDLVLLDVIMPIYDGFYGLEKIRDYDSAAKIIMLTGDSSYATEKHLKKMNPTKIIYKPYEEDDIVSAIDSVLTNVAVSQNLFWNKF